MQPNVGFEAYIGRLNHFNVPMTVALSGLQIRIVLPEYFQKIIVLLSTSRRPSYSPQPLEGGLRGPSRRRPVAHRLPLSKNKTKPSSKIMIIYGNGF